MLSDRQIVLIIDRHRIFGHFTESAVIRASREVAKVETENFIKFIQLRKPLPIETFDDLWREYSSSLRDARNIP